MAIVTDRISVQRTALADQRNQRPAPTSASQPIPGVPSAPARRPLRRWLGTACLIAAAMVVVTWLTRQQILTAAGDLLVAEDPLVSVDVIAVSNSTSVSDILEAAHLYREGIAPAIVFPTAPAEPYAAELIQLGTPRLLPAEYATWLLELAGVPRAAVHALPAMTDGTETNIAAIAAYARQVRPSSLMYVTARSHTTRARWLLRRELPSGTAIVIHAPRGDTFAPGSWWRSRWMSREVAMEYLRWVNTFVLRDLWADESQPATTAQSPIQK